jgi:ferredoxin
MAAAHGDVVNIRDCGSRNRTFLQVRGAFRLNPGDLLVFGGTRLLFKGLESSAAVATAPAELAPAAAATVAPPPAAAAPAAAADRARAPRGRVGLSVRPIGEVLPIDPSHTLLQQFQAKGWATNDRRKIGGNVRSLSHCEAGTCCNCIVEVLSGGEFLSEPSKQETRNVQNHAAFLVEDLGMKVDASRCRLACKTRAEKEGAIEVNLLGDTVGE